MSALKIPSLHHLARICDPDPRRVKAELLRLAYSTPPFSYDQLLPIIRDMAQVGLPLDQARGAVISKFHLPLAKKNFLEILPLVDKWIGEEKFPFVISVVGRSYPLSRDLHIPFSPPFIIGGKVPVMPWFSFWRSMALTGKKLSLFATIACEIIDQDSNLDGVCFEMLEFNAPGKEDPRVLRRFDMSSVPRLSFSEKNDLLSALVEGYRLAVAEYKPKAKRAFREDVKRPAGDPRQKGFF